MEIPGTKAIAHARALFLGGERAGALAFLGELADSHTASAEVHAQLGEFLMAEGRADEALTQFSLSLERDPRGYLALLNLGILSLEAGRHEHGLKFFQECLLVSPTSPEAWNNLGVAYQRLHTPSPAVQCYVRALCLRPGFVDAMVNLAFAHHQCGDYGEALDCADKALALAPGNPVAHWHRALALLSQGSFREGFTEYEWRLAHPQFTRFHAHIHDSPKPLWDGHIRPGRTLLVHAEQGIGDSIQFSRFLPLVAAQGMRVIFSCPADLVRFLDQMPGVEVVPKGKDVGEFDLQCPLLTLLQRIDFGPENIPGSVPMLRVKPQWRQEVPLPPTSRFRVGLCWKGNASHSDDGHRSTDLSQLRALADIPGVEFVSLQRDATAEELAAFPARMARHEDGITDVAGRAALVNQMHLVVSVDTAVAHIAGVLGVPCWLLLGKACDWRWGGDAESTNWYPGMRIFRQRAHGEWEDLATRVAAALAASLPGMQGSFPSGQGAA